MSLCEFADLVIELARSYPFSVTSWLRSHNRNASVGGVRNSYHLVGLAVDVVLDDKSKTADFQKAAAEMNLQAIKESDHIHVEPAYP